jgi:hypothetical protein
MNKEEYFKFHHECIAKMSQITAAKNKDYTGDSDNPFANFTKVEQLGICSTEQGFLTRITDKLSRIIAFQQTGKLAVLDESVEDTILDCCNYLILMAGYIKSKEYRNTKAVRDNAQCNLDKLLNTNEAEYLRQLEVILEHS